MAKSKSKNHKDYSLVKEIDTPLDIEEEILFAENLNDEKSLEQKTNIEDCKSNIKNSEKSDVAVVNYDEEIIEERLEEAKKAQAPNKKKKSRIVNTIFLIINICLMVFIVNGFLTSLGDGADLVTVLHKQGDRLWWLAVGFAL